MLNRWRIKTLLGISLLFIGGLSFATEPSNTPPATNPENNGQYIVKADDTLYSIAWQFGLDYRVIAAMNHLQAPYDLSIGQRLILVEPQHTAPPGLGNPPIIVKHLSGYPSQTLSMATESKTTSKSPEKNISAGWIWPTAGTVTKGYSTTSDNMNKGIDITGKLGQPVVAAANGEVVYSGNGIPGYGNLIIVKHNTNYLTAYAYNEKNLVKEGQTVKGGEKIALMGTGETTKPELHFEIRYEGQPVNPVNYLPKR
jgi:lipoprotein NlpD